MPSPPESDTSTTTTSPLSSEPISPFSIQSAPSEATSDESPDLGAFTTVFRALNYLQPLRVPLGISSAHYVHDNTTTSNTTTTVTTTTTLSDDSPASASVPRSTVWSHRPIASYLSPNSPSNSTIHTPTSLTTTTILQSPFRMPRSRSLGPRQLPRNPFHGNDDHDEDELEDEAYDTGSNTDRAIEIEDIDEQDLSLDADDSPSLNDEDVVYDFDDRNDDDGEHNTMDHDVGIRHRGRGPARLQHEELRRDASGPQPSLGYLEQALSFIAAEREKWAREKAPRRSLASGANDVPSDPWLSTPRRKRRRKRKNGTVASSGATPKSTSRADGTNSDSPEPATTTTDAERQRIQKKASRRGKSVNSKQSSTSISRSIRILTHSRSTPSLRVAVDDPSDNDDEDDRDDDENDHSHDDSVDVMNNPELIQLQTLATKLRAVFPEDWESLKTAVPALLRRNGQDNISDEEPDESKPLIHIFIDHSNILIGLLNYLKKHYSAAPQHTHHRRRSSNSNQPPISRSLPSTSILSSRPTHSKTPSFSKQQQQQQPPISSSTSSQRTSPTKQSFHYRSPRHISHSALALILERGRKNVDRRVLVTSSPLYQPMDDAEKLGYEVKVYARVLDDGSTTSGSGASGGGASSSSGGKGGGNGRFSAVGSSLQAGKAVAVLSPASASLPAPTTPLTIAGGGRGRHSRKWSSVGSAPAESDQLVALSTSLQTNGNSTNTGNSNSNNHTTPSSRPSIHSTPSRPRYREQGVDELLQLKLHQALSKFDSPPLAGSTIVLATGDGNAGEFNEDGFIGPVRLALRRGWRVELYAWEEGLSKVWRREFAGYMDAEGSPSNAGEGKGVFKIVNMEQFGRDLMKV